MKFLEMGAIDVTGDFNRIPFTFSCCDTAPQSTIPTRSLDIFFIFCKFLVKRLMTHAFNLVFGSYCSYDWIHLIFFLLTSH